MSRYQFIDQLAITEPIQVLCRVLQVSPAGYYQWVRRPGKSATAWQAAAAAAFHRHAHRYGTRRLRAELRAEGHTVGRCALCTWLRSSGLRALSTRPQRPVPRWLTRPLSWPKTGCSVRLHQPRLIRCGSATSPTCR